MKALHAPLAVAGLAAVAWVPHPVDAAGSQESARASSAPQDERDAAREAPRRHEDERAPGPRSSTEDDEPSAANRKPAQEGEPSAANRKPAQEGEPSAANRKPAQEGEREADEPCLASAVTVARMPTHPVEKTQVHLTYCDGRPNPRALRPLSILARPDGVDRPSSKAIARFQHNASPRKRKEFVAPHIMRLHPGLLPRLQTLADRWPGRPLEVISGYRPDERHTSRHYHGRALDIRIDGVHRRRVSAFARKTLDDTGVGFYPNSVFTHIDVRKDDAFWVDRSAPGEPADYGPWPPRRERHARLEKEVRADLGKLRSSLLSGLEEGLGSVRATRGSAAMRRARSKRGKNGPTGTATPARAAPENGNAPDKTETPDEDAVGGLMHATGVVDAWSTVPHEDEE